MTSARVRQKSRRVQTSIFRTKARLHLGTVPRLELLFDKTERTVVLPRDDKTRDMRRHAIVQMAKIVVHGHYLLHGAPTPVRRRISAHNTRAGATIPYRRADPPMQYAQTQDTPHARPNMRSVSILASSLRQGCNHFVAHIGGTDDLLGRRIGIGDIAHAPAPCSS